MSQIRNNETGALCPVGERGELMIKGACLMLGYLKDEAATSAAFDRDGFLHTGDVAYFDSDGCLYIVDRIKEMLKYRSWHVVPAEVEDVLRSHPAVTEAAVVGVPHLDDGQHPAAVVVLDKNTPHAATPQQILDFVNGKRRCRAFYELLLTHSLHRNSPRKEENPRRNSNR